MDITLAYSELEDRIWLRTHGQVFWITQRMLMRFLPATTALLENTVPGGEVPNALPPEQRIQIDHEEALAETPEGAPAMKRGKENPPESEYGEKPQVVSTMKIIPSGSNWVLMLIAADQEMKLTFNRRDLHRLLGAMVFAIKRAQWPLNSLPEWLAKTVV